MQRHLLRYTGSLQRSVLAISECSFTARNSSLTRFRRKSSMHIGWPATNIPLGVCVPDVRRFKSSDVNEVWRQTTNRVLESKIGSFDSKMWSEAHMAILWWMKNSDWDSVRQPFYLLDRMCKEESTLGTVEAGDFYKTELLNLVLNHWRKIVSDQRKLPTEFDLQPQALFDKLQQFHEKSEHLRPNKQSYAMVIDGISACSSKTSEPNDAVLVAERILEWLIKNSTEHSCLCPNVFVFSSMMNVWVKSGRAEAPEKVEKLLEDMKRLHIEYPDWDVSPNQFTYVTAIDTWAKVGRVDRVEGLLKEMHAEYRDGAEDLRPSIMAFNGYLVALARNGETEKAETVLQHMEDLHSSGELVEPPNVISYSAVLDAFAKYKHVGAAERAESILRRMIDQGIKPNNISYNSVIDAFAKSQNVERAESLLNEMYELYAHGNFETKPTMRTYCVVLSAWSSSRSPEAGERGEKLLNLMKDLANSGEIDAPDIVAYNTVLDCWVKSEKGCAEKARSFLEKMVQDGVIPDVYSYNTTIHAMIQAGDIRGAESMLDTMRKVGVAPDTTSYNTLLAAWIKFRSKEASSKAADIFERMQQDKNVKSDLVTFNIMLHSYSKSGNGKRAESLFNEMCEEKSLVRPDSVSYNTVISAWSRSQDRDAPKRAEIILEKMIEHDGNVQPNSITFNSVIGVWLKSKSPETASNCERIFGVMNDMYEDGHLQVKPDAVTFNSLIRAWSLSTDEEASERAEAVFHEMKRQYESGDGRSKPTAATYGSLINVWAKSKRHHAGQKAEDYLRSLIEQADSGQVQERPRVFEFTLTIEAWAHSGDPKAIYKADEILYLLLKEVKAGNKEATPDSRLFGTILLLLASCDIPDKAKYADRLIGLMKDHRIRPDSFLVSQLKKCYSERIAQFSTNELG